MTKLFFSLSTTVIKTAKTVNKPKVNIQNIGLKKLFIKLKRYRHKGFFLSTLFVHTNLFLIFINVDEIVITDYFL